MIPTFLCTLFCIILLKCYCLSFLTMLFPKNIPCFFLFKLEHAFVNSVILEFPLLAFHLLVLFFVLSFILQVGAGCGQNSDSSPICAYWNARDYAYWSQFSKDWQDSKPNFILAYYNILWSPISIFYLLRFGVIMVLFC